MPLIIWSSQKQHAGDQLMPFHTEDIAETKLNSIQDVADWISDTQRFLKRIPVAGVLEHGATFRDDEYLGDGDALFHFNHPGFAALCQKLGCRQDLLDRLKTPALPSQVLNDLLSQRDTRKALESDEFVIDERTGTIIGLVSKSYVTYSNDDMLTDITSRMGSLPQDDEMKFMDAYGINTALTVRFVSLRRHGTINGRGGQGEDRSELGLVFENSMVGTSAVRINYFLHRLLCANGMMIKAAESVSRVFHAGRGDTFQKRLDRCFNEVVRNLSQLQAMLTSLGSLPFQPDQLARNRVLTDQIFDIVPGTKLDLCQREDLFLRYPPEASTSERESIRQAHDARLIKLIPLYLGREHSNRVFTTGLRDGATLFDFVNVFTEYAKEQQPSTKLDIEESAGALAKYFASTAKQL